MANNRIEYLDLVKFFAICLVCIGHSYAKVPTLESSLCPIIYSFHMPLFMLVCGYFSVHSLELPTKELLLKKGKQLLLPALSCTMLSFLLYGGHISDEIVGCVWFLKTLFICYLIARICRWCRMPIALNFFISWLVLLVIPYGGTLQINFLYSYFIIGYLLHKWQDTIYRYRLSLFICSVLFFICSVSLHWAVPCVKVDLYFLLHSPMSFVRQLFVGLSGSIVVVGMCEIIDYFVKQKEAIHKYIAYLSVVGRFTLGIYVVQTFLLERSFPILPIVEVKPYLIDYIVVPIIGFMVCVVCYYVVKLTKQIKLMNTLFYGGLNY